MPLATAATDCVEALIGAGADVNVPTPEGVTPLMIALDNDHNDVAKLLLDRGANPHVSDWWGRTALYIVIDRKESAGVVGEVDAELPRLLAAQARLFLTWTSSTGCWPRMST